MSTSLLEDGAVSSSSFVQMTHREKGRPLSHVFCGVVQDVESGRSLCRRMSALQIPFLFLVEWSQNILDACE